MPLTPPPPCAAVSAGPWATPTACVTPPSTLLLPVIRTPAVHYGMCHRCQRRPAVAHRWSDDAGGCAKEGRHSKTRHTTSCSAVKTRKSERTNAVPPATYHACDRLMTSRRTWLRAAASSASKAQTAPQARLSAHPHHSERNCRCTLPTPQPPSDPRHSHMPHHHTTSTSPLPR